MALVLTPGEIADYQATVADGIEALNGDIQACRTFDPSKLSAWNRYRERFIAWRRDNSSTWALMWGATMDAAERYAGMLEQWREVFRRQCDTEPSAPGTPTDSAPPGEVDFYRGIGSAIKWLGIAIVGGMLLYALTPGLRRLGSGSGRRRAAPTPAPRAAQQRPLRLQLFEDR